jgi:Fe-S-cluster containining protein
MNCTKCGACCVAPDIAALGKPLGVRCPHLTDDNLCAVYENRPQICRDYAADWLCDLVQAPTLDQRVQKYLRVFGMQAADGGPAASAAEDGAP